MEIQQSQQQINYQSFEQLQDFPSNMQLDQLRQQLVLRFKNALQWSEQFEGINDLRRLNKFRTQEFIQNILSEFFDMIVDQIDQIRSNLSKNALILVKELFVVNKASLITLPLYQKLLPKIFLKGINDKAFIKTEAQQVLKSIEMCKDGLCYNLIFSLCEMLNDKNFQIQELTCTTINNLLKNNEENIKGISKESLTTLTLAAANMMAAKRQYLIKTSKEMWGYLQQRVGNYIFEFLNENQKKMVEATLAQKKEQEKSGFQEFLKKKKNTQQV